MPPRGQRAERRDRRAVARRSDRSADASLTERGRVSRRSRVSRCDVRAELAAKSRCLRRSTPEMPSGARRRRRRPAAEDVVAKIRSRSSDEADNCKTCPVCASLYNNHSSIKRADSSRRSSTTRFSAGDSGYALLCARNASSTTRLQGCISAATRRPSVPGRRRWRRSCWRSAIAASARPRGRRSRSCEHARRRG